MNVLPEPNRRYSVGRKHVRRIVREQRRPFSERESLEARWRSPALYRSLNPQPTDAFGLVCCRPRFLGRSPGGSLDPAPAAPSLQEAIGGVPATAERGHVEPRFCGRSRLGTLIACWRLIGSLKTR